MCGQIEDSVNIHSMEEAITTVQSVESISVHKRN